MPPLAQICSLPWYSVSPSVYQGPLTFSVPIVLFSVLCILKS